MTLLLLSGVWFTCLAAVVLFVHGAGCHCPKCGRRYDE